MRCSIDHLTVTAPSLEAGADHVLRALGVSPGPGGSHPLMGTHNPLLRLGESRFLEVIAVDPAAPRPARQRWFALDDPVHTAAPRLSTWVARTDTLSGCPAALRELLGPAQPMSRGAREWLITMAPDGLPALEGTLPSLIEWTVPASPAARALPHAGCELLELTLFQKSPGDSPPIRKDDGREGAAGETLEPRRPPAVVSPRATPPPRRQPLQRSRATQPSPRRQV